VCIELAGTPRRILTTVLMRLLNTLTHTVSVKNFAEDADDVFLVVSYIMKIMLYIRCYPNETTMVMNCGADAKNVG